MTKETAKNETRNGDKRVRKPDQLELSLFCHQMALVLKSGIHPLEGVPLIADEVDNPQLKRALGHISVAMAKGKALHEAMAKETVFPGYLVEMTRLGVQTGMLDTVMESLAVYYDRDFKLKRRLRSAITYPAILGVLMLGVILLLVLKILPMFSDILSSLGGEMPAATKVLMGVGLFFRIVLPLLILACAGAVGWFLYMRRTEAGRERTDALLLKLPWFGNVNRKVATARFSNAIALVLKSGMTLEEGLQTVKDCMDNRHVRLRIDKISEAIRAGEEASVAIDKAELFPRLFVRMIRVGQKTGELDVMLAKISDVYDEEVDRSLSTMTNAIEPVLVIVLSVIVAIILLAVMLPLINIMGAIG